MANNVQLLAALQQGSFAEVAPILDRCELEVNRRSWIGSRAAARAERFALEAAAALPPQSGNPHVLLDWPHALHILGHLYNNNL